MAPMQVSMRASAATLAVLGLLAASFAGGASGAGSPNVAALQVGLRTHGLYAGTVDGVLGPRTERALMRFQRRAGLSPDGVDRTAHAQGVRPVRTARAARAARPGDRLAAAGTSRRFSSRSRGTASRRRSSTACSVRTPTRRCGSSSVWAGSRSRTEPQGPSTYAALRRPVPRSPIKLLASGRRRLRRPVRSARQPLPCGHRHPGRQGHARRRRRSRASRLRGSRRGVRQARRARARARRQDPLRAPVADHRSRRPVREGPRHGRPGRSDGRGDRPAPALRSAGAGRQRGSIVRPLTRTTPAAKATGAATGRCQVRWYR